MNYFVFAGALILSYSSSAQGHTSYDCPTDVSKAMRKTGTSYIALEAGAKRPFTYKDVSKTKGALYKSDNQEGFYVAAFAFKPLNYWLEIYSGLQAMDVNYGLRSNFTQGGSEVYDILYNIDFQLRIPLGINLNLTYTTQLSIAPAIVYSHLVQQGKRIGYKNSGGAQFSGSQAEFIDDDFAGSIQLGGDLRATQTIYKRIRVNVQFSIDSKPLSPLSVSARLLNEDGSRKTYRQALRPTMMYAGLGVSYRFL